MVMLFLLMQVGSIIAPKDYMSKWIYWSKIMVQIMFLLRIINLYSILKE